MANGDLAHKRENPETQTARRGTLRGADVGFASRLRQACRRYEIMHDEDLTQAELARRVGKQLGREPVPAPTVNAWFRGAVPDHPETITAIAEVLDCDRDWLFFGPKHVIPRDADVLDRLRLARHHTDVQDPVPIASKDRTRRQANGP